MAFPVLMALAIFSYLMGEQQTMKHFGFGYPAWVSVSYELIHYLKDAFNISSFVTVE
jgi:hypothetical protein